MKKTIFRILVTVLISCSVLLNFASCSGGIDRDEAKLFIESFFSEISSENYKGAEARLHPDRNEDLEAFFTGIEAAKNVDFQSGITVESYTGFSYSWYNSTVDGSTLKYTIDAKIGNASAVFDVEIVKNDNGYGIYYLNLIIK
jgi:hypothetical protein